MPPTIRAAEFERRKKRVLARIKKETRKILVGLQSRSEVGLSRNRADASFADMSQPDAAIDLAEADRT